MGIRDEIVLMIILSHEASALPRRLMGCRPDWCGVSRINIQYSEKVQACVQEAPAVFGRLPEMGKTEMDKTEIWGTLCLNR
jgi:hypothetical protein